MDFRFIADQAREAVMNAYTPYTPEEVYEKIERLAERGYAEAIFRKDRLSEELMEMLTEDGYGLRTLPWPSGSVICVTWGAGSRKLREGSAAE